MTICASDTQNRRGDDACTSSNSRDIIDMQPTSLQDAHDF